MKIINEHKNCPNINIDNEKVYYFQAVIDELYNLAQKYKNYNLFSNQFSNLTVEVKYASGSKSLHRGFFCPSPTFDLVVGGCKRGRIIKKPAKASSEYYQYYFDHNQQLLCINQFIKASNLSPYTTEFIIRQDNIEYGITYHNASKDISYLTKCDYENNKIRNYATVCYFDGISKDMMSLQFEEYEYTNDVLSKVVMYPGIIPKDNLYNNTEFELLYDNNHIVEYIASSVYQGQRIENRYIV